MPPIRTEAVLMPRKPYARAQPPYVAPYKVLNSSEQAMRDQLDTPGDITLELSFLDGIICPMVRTLQDNDIPDTMHTTTSRSWDTAASLSLLEPTASKAAGPSNHIAKIIHLIHGEITPEMFLTYLQSSGNFNPLQQEVENAMVKKLALVWQRQTGDFIIGGVVRFRDMLPQHALDLASQKQRAAIWRKIYKRAPLQVIKRMIGSRYEAVDLELIYNFPTKSEPRRAVWRRLLSHIFEWSCESAFHHTQGVHGWDGVSRDMRKLFYNNWRSFVGRREFRQLDIHSDWTISKCPARPCPTIPRPNLGRANQRLEVDKILGPAMATQPTEEMEIDQAMAWDLDLESNAGDEWLGFDD